LKEDTNDDIEEDGDKGILKEALDRFKLCSEAEQDNRADYVDDIKFASLGEQWPEHIRNQREEENRPCLTFNKMPAFTRQVINDARLNKPSIKVSPFGPGSDKDTAEILTGLIRNIEQSSNADVAYDTAMETAVNGGIGYIRVGVEYTEEDTFDLDICIERVSNPLTIYGDHTSTAADSHDWDYAFVVNEISEDEYKEKYPKAEIISYDSDMGEEGTEWFDEGTVRVAEYWVREKIPGVVYQLSDGSVVGKEEMELLMEGDLQEAGLQIVDQREITDIKVTQYIISGAEVLETNDWTGKYIPLIPVYGDEVWSEGKRHWQSLIRHAKDAQRSFNYWQTSAAEKVALDTKSPWIGPKGAFDDDQKWMTANTKNHPYLEYKGPVPPARTPAGGVPASDLSMAMQANDLIKSIIGIHDASLGAQGNETSGKGIIARQREGDVSTFHFIDNLSRAIRHTGRIVVDLIPKIYDKERQLRVIGEDGTPDTVQVNEPFEDKGDLKLYDLTSGKYDVTVSSGPSFTSKREESATQMMELVRVYPAAAERIGDLIAKNLDWPGADDIAKRLKPPGFEDDDQDPQVAAMQQEMEQMKQQGMQMIQELQGQLEEATKKAEDVQTKNQIEAQDNQIQSQLEAQKLRIAEYEAETKRISAMQTGLTTEQVQELVLQTLQQLKDTTL
jgi:hypothetical protein